MATLTTERLILRPWRDADLAPFAALNADRRVMEYFPAPLNRAVSDALARRIGGLLDHFGFGLWAVEVPGEVAFAGFVGLNPVPEDLPFTPAMEVGWRLAAEHWGRGYATEGARVALDFAFDRLELAEVVSFTVPGNRRSIAVMERLGLARDPGADFEHPAIPPGHPLRPHVLYRIDRAEWAARG